jgi:tetratricopeptide (TPR) repeat protein
MAAGRFDDAIASYRKALEAAPDDAATRLELARVLGHVGRYAEAEPEFTRVIATVPRSEEAWRGRVLALLLADRLDAAKVAMRDALQVFPRSSAMANALARLLATAEAPGVRDPALALELARRVHQSLASASSAETLAAALAESGKFEEAVALQRPIAAAAGDGQQSELARARLAAYERGEPWRLRAPNEIADLLTAPPG